MTPKISAKCIIFLELDEQGEQHIFPEHWFNAETGQLDVSYDAFYTWYNAGGKNRLLEYFVQDVNAIISQGDAWDLTEIEIEENEPS